MDDDNIISYLLRTACHDLFIAALDAKSTYRLRLTSATNAQYIGKDVVGEKVLQEWKWGDICDYMCHLNIDQLRRTFKSTKKGWGNVRAVILTKIIVSGDKKLYDSICDELEIEPLDRIKYEAFFEVLSPPPWKEKEMIKFIEDAIGWGSYEEECKYLPSTYIGIRFAENRKYTPRIMGLIEPDYGYPSMDKALKHDVSDSGIITLLNRELRGSTTTETDLRCYITTFLVYGRISLAELCFHMIDPSKIRDDFWYPERVCDFYLLAGESNEEWLRNRLGDEVFEEMVRYHHYGTKDLERIMNGYSSRSYDSNTHDNKLCEFIQSYGDAITERALENILSIVAKDGKIPEKFVKAICNTKSKNHILYELRHLWSKYVDKQVVLKIAAGSWPIGDIRKLDWSIAEDIKKVLTRAINENKDEEVFPYLSRYAISERNLLYVDIVRDMLSKKYPNKYHFMKNLPRLLRRIFREWDPDEQMSAELKRMIVNKIYENGSSSISYTRRNKVIINASRVALHYITEIDPAWKQAMYYEGFAQREAIIWIKNHIMIDVKSICGKPPDSSSL